MSTEAVNYYARTKNEADPEGDDTVDFRAEVYPESPGPVELKRDESRLRVVGRADVSTPEVQSDTRAQGEETIGKPLDKTPGKEEPLTLEMIDNRIEAIESLLAKYAPAKEADRKKIRETIVHTESPASFPPGEERVRMPECPECGTWNPDDKRQCWRCDAPLPIPKPPKPKRRPINWVWLAAGFFLLFTIVQGCMALQSGRPAPAPSAVIWAAPSSPSQQSNPYGSGF